MACLAYEAACATGLGSFGCLGLGAVELNDGAVLYGSCNSGADFEVDLRGGKLCFNGETIRRTLNNRVYDETDQFIIEDYEWDVRDAEQAVALSATAASNASIKVAEAFSAWDAAYTDRALEGAYRRAVTESERLQARRTGPQNRLEDAEAVLEAARLKAATSQAHCDFLMGLVTRTEAILAAGTTPESDLYRRLLQRGARVVTGPGTKHAEMRILEAVDGAGARPLSIYIATDKVCCYSCFSMMLPFAIARQLLAMDGGPPLMGTHGHIFANWAAPVVRDIQLAKSPACDECGGAATARALGASIEEWPPSLGNVESAIATLKVQNADFLEVLACYDE